MVPSSNHEEMSRDWGGERGNGFQSRRPLSTTCISVPFPLGGVSHNRNTNQKKAKICDRIEQKNNPLVIALIFSTNYFNINNIFFIFLIE